MSSILISKILLTEKENLDAVLTTKGRIYTFLNPVSYLDARSHSDLFEEFDGIWADGSLLASAIKLFYGINVTRRSFDMTSIAPLLFDYASKQRKTIYIVASRHEDVEHAVDIFRSKNMGMNIIRFRDGYFSSDKEIDDEIARICRLQPDYLIVGMGMIRQEEFLVNVKKAGYHGIGFTCGGFIHQVARGEINYYPAWINRMNLRFVYRMVREKHTRSRYVRAAVLFPAKFIYDRIF